MPIVLIAIYCFIAILVLFGLTFRAELHDEKTRNQKRPHSLSVIDGGKGNVAKLHHHV